MGRCFLTAVTGVESVSVSMEMSSVSRRFVRMSGDSVTAQLSPTAALSVRIVSSEISSIGMERSSQMCPIPVKSVSVREEVSTVPKELVQLLLAHIQSGASVALNVGQTVCITIS